MVHYIENDFFGKEGRLTNNFKSTIAENLKPSALKAFKDGYLLYFIGADELEYKRQIEQLLVLISETSYCERVRDFATIKYPEILAEIYPYFQHDKLPNIGNESSWYVWYKKTFKNSS